jgi:hypothetical protein
MMRLKFFTLSASILAAVASAVPARADVKWSEIRIYGTNNKIGTTPDTFNALTAADGVNGLTNLSGLGIEADVRLGRMLKVGTRVRGVWNLNTANNAPNPPTAFVAVQQFQGSLFFRIPILDQDWLTLDGIGEGGVENTHIDVTTTSNGAGTFTRNSSFFERAGASVGIGWKSIKFFFEAGQEWNYLDNMTFEGTLNNNIKNLDLSGPYFAFGIIISGVPSWIKPGGVSTKD